jgi:osmotically-inducible protein OsmY
LPEAFYLISWSAILIKLKKQNMCYSKIKLFAVGLLFSTSVFVTSCKGKKDNNATTNVDTAATTPIQSAPAPVEISADDALTTGVKDATKDYPGVNATVNNGEITLTGEIQRSRLQNLMQSLQSLRPKKINNQLTIK